jgi:hypothetical protein
MGSRKTAEMIRRHIAFLFLLALPAAAQFTTVTGTVTDPNTLPYAFGTIVPTLVSSSTPKFTSTNLPYTPPTQPVGLDGTGSFVMNLADVTTLTPGGSTYNFQVCSGPNATVFPAFGKGPVCFSVTGVTISGASQSITSTLVAAAVPLTVNFGGGGSVSGSGTTGRVAVWTSTSAIGAPSPFTASAGQVQLGFGGGPLGNSVASIGVSSIVQPSVAACTGGNTNLVPNIACQGFQLQFNPFNSSSNGTTAAMTILASGAQAAQTLHMGLFINTIGSFNVTEERAAYILAADTLNETTTTRRAIFAIADNATGNTTTTNETIVAQSGGSTGTNTNDFTIHVLAPLSGAALTTHAGLKVDAQTTGVEFQIGAHTFAALPACSATFEGSMAAVTDATSATNGATVAGSGTHHVLAYCNSVNWLVVVGT